MSGTWRITRGSPAPEETAAVTVVLAAVLASAAAAEEEAAARVRRTGRAGRAGWPSAVSAHGAARSWTTAPGPGWKNAG